MKKNKLFKKLIPGPNSTEIAFLFPIDAKKYFSKMYYIPQKEFSLPLSNSGAQKHGNSKYYTYKNGH